MNGAPAAPAADREAFIDAVEGPSYPVGLKLFACTLVAAVVASGLRAADVIADAGLPAGVVAAMGLAAVLVATGWLGIVCSRTRIDGERIVQQGLWRREVALADIVQLRLIEAPRLSAFVAARLMVRARGGWPLVFSSGDARVVAAWRRLAWGEAAG